MIKKLFPINLHNLLFYFLLFLPLLHFWGAGRMYIKPIFLITVSLTAILFFNKAKLLFPNIWTSLVIQLLILFAFSKFYFNWEIQIIPYVYLLALFLFYKIAVFFLSSNKSSHKTISIIRIYILLISIEIGLFMFSEKITFLKFYPNESIFSILLATHLLFIFPHLKRYSERFAKTKKLQNTLIICYFLLCYTLLFYTKGRAGILGFTIANIALNYGYLKSKIGYWKGIIIVLCLLLVLFNYKSNSSSGRILIYKVIATQLEPNEIITGIGYSKFKVKYNLLQAKYFSDKSIDSSEALLASNTTYMFNDSLQLIIEIGLIGLIILCFLIIKLIILLKRNYNSLEERPILNGAYLSVVCIVISSLFSYPFQITGILLHFLFCIAIIVHSNPLEKTFKRTILAQKSNLIIAGTALLSSTFSLLFFGLESFKFYIKLNEAIKYSNLGFRKKAIQTYHKISNNSIEDSDVLYNYADELSKVNKIDSALIVLHQSSYYLNNDKSALLMGNLLEAKRMFSEAEKNYKEAIFMNPKLFINRASLFKFYYETKQYKKAQYWGNSILNMPIKVHSQAIIDVKNETKKLMLEIKTK
ncbi:tetratricopeptide repeat protein [Flavobacterium sp. KACC 22761]|uniref:tetratricopeptide repeat protein n=1 Tax=Flavobacterium sp. KACC 22761 TaxID=3092665 RepID=UPI002A75931E|nr:O-antigen ligase family protein [Flavobacterium sp. KACC 22761]WPO78559.1 O-antigen ligase family protein [Flavobacterium sp. KACC 22761]